MTLTKTYPTPSPSPRSTALCFAAALLLAPAGALGQTAAVGPTAAPAAPSGGADAVQPAPSPASPTKEGLIVLVRAGASASGGGTMSSKCEGPCGEIGEASFDDESSTAISGELLGQIGPSLRVGGGVFWVPKPTLRMGGEDIASGNEYSAHGVVEGAFRTSGTTAITLRAQGGPLVLVSGRDHARGIDAAYDDCLYGADHCSNQREFVGATFGIGAGVLLRTESLALRADMLAQTYAVDWGELAVDVEGESFTLRDTASGGRIWVMAGLEL